MHFDFHTMPGIDGLLSGFDAERFAEKLSESHVEFINFSARCNIGFSYYDTKVGIKYPGLIGDPVADTIAACHKRGIGVSLYINVGLNHEMSVRNHGWCRIDKEGRIYQQDKVNNFFRTMCYNTGYRDYVKSEIRELLEYDVDGIFCDCMVTRPCYCPGCIRKMRELSVDIKDDAAVLAYQDSLVLEMYREIHAIIKERRPEAYVYFNSNFTVPGLHTHAEVECLPSSKHWGSDYFYPAASFARAHYDKLVYMTGRFADCWGDLGGIKPVEAIQSDLYDAMMQGYDFSVGDHLHPVTGLFDETADRVGRVFAEKMLYEKYDEGAKYVSEVGIIVPPEDYRAPEYLIGAARMLCELKIPYSEYTAEDDFSREKLLILPRAIEVTPAFREKIAEHRRRGGKLLFIGEGADMAAALGEDKIISELSEDTSDNAYFLMSGSDMQWAMYKPARKFRCNGARELARYVSGMFNLEFDGLHTYFYRPQGELTELSAAVTDGNTAFVCYDAFEAYASNFLKETKLLVGEAIDSLLPDREILTVGLPSTANVSITKNDSHRIFHLKLTHPAIRNGRGIVEDHAYLDRASISVRGECRVYKLPEYREVPAEIANGRTNFAVESIKGYAAFLLK